MLSTKRFSWTLSLCALLLAPTLCLAAAGDLDLTFGADGKVITNFYEGSDDVARDLDVCVPPDKLRLRPHMVGFSRRRSVQVRLLP